MLSDFRKKKLLKLFKVFDANENGYLDMNDAGILTTRFSQEFEWPPGGEMDRKFKAAFLKVWTKMFREADFNNDKRVTKDEFLEYYSRITANDSQFFMFIKPFFDEVFKAIDADQNGLWSKEDYKSFYRAWGNRDDEAEVAFSKLDTNKDGAISHLELYTMFYHFFMGNNSRHRSKLFFGKLPD